jgi:hypothetical protein
MGICFAALAITSHPNGNPIGQLRGGHLQVQGPVSALVFDKLTEEQLQHRPDSFLWTVKAGPNIFWDDSASEEAAENKQCFFLIIQSHYTLGDMAPDHCGLILEPTGLKRGQFQRISVVLHAYMWGVTDIDAFLHKDRNPELLEDTFYQEADPDLGFTLEII